MSNTKETNMPKKKEIAIVVTTAHKGVFFGYTTDDVSNKTLSLKRARMCVYWSADVRGMPGLAGAGPTSSCRVSPAADIDALHDVTGVWRATPEAVEAWEAQPWG